VIVRPAQVLCCVVSVVQTIVEQVPKDQSGHSHILEQPHAAVESSMRGVSHYFEQLCLQLNYELLPFDASGSIDLLCLGEIINAAPP